MLLRYGRLGHCRRHRHVASTLTMVLEGEQYISEWQIDGSKKSVLRKKGDYALASADALPHDERRGEEGGMVLLSMTAPDGILFEYFDENMEKDGPFQLSNLLITGIAERFMVLKICKKSA